MKNVSLTFIIVLVFFSVNYSQNSDSLIIISNEASQINKLRFFIYAADYNKMTTPWDYSFELGYQKSYFNINLKERTLSHLINNTQDDYIISSFEFVNSCLILYTEQRINKQYQFTCFFKEGKIYKILKKTQNDNVFTYYNK